MKSITISIPAALIGIMLSEPDQNGRRHGAISTTLQHPDAEEPDPALDAVESLILAHACAGVDVESPAYVEGIETALDAISNNS